MAKSIHILIVDDLHPSLMEGLDKKSISYSYQPDIKPADVAKEMANFNVLIVRSKIQLDSMFFDMNPQLELVARAGSGMDNIDLETAHSRGITCINAPEANCDAVGEQSLATLLSLLHNVVKGNTEVSNGKWDREGNRGVELGSLTVGIIGYGHTGSAVARKLSGFGCEVLAYDKYKEDFGSEGVKEVSLTRLMEDSDVVSFHVPLTEETTKWVSTEFVDTMRKPFVLLNLSRGGIMETSAIIDGLKSGKILAFGTDVLENEKLDRLSEKEHVELDFLTSASNVIVTPHVGGWSKQSYKKISRVLLEKIWAWGENKNIAENRHRRNTHFVG